MVGSESGGSGLAADIRLLQADLADAQADRDRQSEALARLQASLLSARQEIASIRTENINLQVVVSLYAALQEEAAGLRAQILRLDAALREAAGLRSHLRAVYASVSWRLFTPMRGVMRMLRRS